MAGLTAAIHLALNGREVLVFEKRAYPHHKVCGEYISKEIVPYLNFLGIPLSGAVNIDTFQFSTRRGKAIEAELPMGGLGISRYTLDYNFYKRAIQLGVSFCFEAVKSVHFSQGQFSLTDESGERYKASLVIGAYGKRSELDKKLKRSFMTKKSPWVGVKMHYHYSDFPANRVELHNFPGGYAGLSKVENGNVNFCYLSDYKRFKLSKNINNFNSDIVASNPFLKDFFEKATPTFDKPLAIAQFSFSKKRSVENHMLMCGDTAGLIHPLCGNGMAMAVHSAKIASESILKFMDKADYSRQQMEMDYSSCWKANFSRRLAYGRKMQFAFLRPRLADNLVAVFARSPGLMKMLIKKTHGNLIQY